MKEKGEGSYEKVQQERAAGGSTLQLLRKEAGCGAWDYFSEKDGQVHHFDLCEDCYDEWISGFRLPVETEEQIELLQAF